MFVFFFLLLENRALYKTFRLHPHYFYGPGLTSSFWHPAGSVLPGAVLLEDDSSKLRVGREELLVIAFEQRWKLSKK